MDDPLSLLGVAVWLMAAGMWPVGLGYMFGVCSACCDECPDECNLCTHAYNQSDSCEDLIESLTINGFELTCEDLTCEPIEGGISCIALDSPVFVGIEFQPAPEELLCLEGGLNPEAAVISGFATDAAIDITCGTDECGCGECTATISVAYSVSYEDGFFSNTFLSGAGATANVTDCDSGELPLTFSGYAPDIGSPECRESIQAWLQENYPIESGTLFIAECECGACCDGAQCVENVAAGGCEDWQGVGVGCDPDPCPPPPPPQGACCGEDDACTQTTEAACVGVWTEGVECDPNPCVEPPPMGACCDDEGNCTQTTEGDCAGVWTEGVACDPNPCPPMMGACCDDEGNCTQETEDDCVAADGAWYPLTSCDDAPC